MFSGMIEVNAIEYEFVHTNNNNPDFANIEIKYTHKVQISIDKIESIENFKRTCNYTSIKIGSNAGYLITESIDEIKHRINEAILDSPFYRILSNINKKMELWK